MSDQRYETRNAYQRIDDSTYRRIDASTTFPPMFRTSVVALLLALVAVACGDDDTSAVTSPEYQAFREQPTACGAERPDAAAEFQFSAPDDLGLSGTVTAVLQTSCGDITLELDATAAPATVNSFVFLAESGYFDGTVSHRVLSGFVIQAGDPTASGFGGPGYTLPDELPADGFLYAAGTVAMANSGPNSGGSQFFLVLADAPLNPGFSVFGRVVAGMDVMDRIASIPMGQSAGLEPSRPLETLYLETVSIER